MEIVQGQGKLDPSPAIQICFLGNTLHRVRDKKADRSQQTQLDRTLHFKTPQSPKVNLHINEDILTLWTFPYFHTFS
jgi:hypothetical protein